jgi:hypothetical protein
MLSFFTRIIIFTMIMTAPLSYMGDKCPDFRPDFRTQSPVEESRRVTVNQERAAQKILLPVVQFSPAPSVCSPLDVPVPVCTSPLLTLHGRAPPRCNTTILS